MHLMVKIITRVLHKCPAFFQQQSFANSHMGSWTTGKPKTASHAPEECANFAARHHAAGSGADREIAACLISPVGALLGSRLSCCWYAPNSGWQIVMQKLDITCCASLPNGPLTPDSTRRRPCLRATLLWAESQTRLKAFCVHLDSGRVRNYSGPIRAVLVAVLTFGRSWF